VNVFDNCLYLTDYDLVENMPLHHQDLVSNFGLPGVLPGGSLCMMNPVSYYFNRDTWRVALFSSYFSQILHHQLTPASRPMMGPNLYITPPSSFTHFHQDGFGTVDSGHLCLAGYNEIVMLRRLPHDHKENAMNILTGRHRSEDSSKPRYDGLYKLPHGADNVSLW